MGYHYWIYVGSAALIFLGAVGVGSYFLSKKMEQATWGKNILQVFATGKGEARWTALFLGLAMVAAALLVRYLALWIIVPFAAVLLSFVFALLILMFKIKVADLKALLNQTF